MDLLTLSLDALVSLKSNNNHNNKRREHLKQYEKISKKKFLTKFYKNFDRREKKRRERR